MFQNIKNIYFIGCLKKKLTYEIETVLFHTVRFILILTKQCFKNKRKKLLEKTNK